MPLADLTAIANLALSHLGEPFLDDYATDTGLSAEAVRLHLPQCKETVLEGHVWSFATRCQQLTTAPVTVTTAELVTGTEGDNNAILWTATGEGPGGNDISVVMVDEYPVDGLVTVDGNKITVSKANLELTVVMDIGAGPVTKTLIPAGEYQGKPAWSEDGDLSHYPSIYYTELVYYEESYHLVYHPTPFGYHTFVNAAARPDAGTWEDANEGGTNTVTVTGTDATAAEVIAAALANAAAALLVTATDYGTSDGSGTVATLAETHLAGGSSTAAVYAPAYGSAFNLPADCLRVIKIDGADLDIPRNEWEIQGRYVLLQEAEAEAPVIHYISHSPPVDEWPTTFTDAVAFLLAARLAPVLKQSDGADFIAKHELALGKARSKDARETRSKENHGPRQLAARCVLVNARYGNTQPPY